MLARHGPWMMQDQPQQLAEQLLRLVGHRVATPSLPNLDDGYTLKQRTAWGLRRRPPNPM